jgi:hypothetical protein
MAAWLIEVCYQKIPELKYIPLTPSEVEYKFG